MRPGLLIAALLTALPAASPAARAQDETVAYHARRIYADPAAGCVEDGWLVVEGGRVRSVVRSAAELPPLAPVVELGDAVILPGLVAADSALGSPRGGTDHALGAHLRAADDLDLYEEMSPALARGVTTVYVTPDRSRLIGGRGAVAKLTGGARLLVEESDLRIGLTPEAWNPPGLFRPPIPPTSENPIRPPQAQPPSSQAGAVMALRETAAAALSAEAHSALHLKALAAFLKARGRVRVDADTRGEIAAALRLAGEWRTPLVLDGGREAWRLAGEIASARAGLIFEVPLFLSMPDGAAQELMPAADCLARLRAAGVPVALCVGRHGDWRWLLEAAAAAVGYGLSESEAVAGITQVPAQLLGVADRVGSLLPGRDADFVVLSADPLDPAARVWRVFVDGREAWSGARVTAADPDATHSIVVRAGTLWTGEGPPIRGGAELLLQNGKVVAAGPRVPHPLGARVIDGGPDAHLAPGFIDALGHLGLAPRARVDARELVGWLSDGSALDPEWLAVARAGVTTVVISPENVPLNGQRLQAVKTSVSGPDGLYVEGRDLVRFEAAGGDRADRGEQLRRSLKKGQAYFQQWEKYRESRKKWEAEQAEKEATEARESEADLRKRLALGKKPEKEEEQKEEEKQEEEKKPEEEQKVDPINGKWEATIEDPRLPQPARVLARLAHEGTRLTGIFSAPDFAPGEEFELEGTFENMRMRFEIASQFGIVLLTGEIDAPEHMECRLEVAGMGSVDFEAVRTQIDAAGGLAGAPRRRAKKDDGPQAPKFNWGLEGQRALFEGRAVALVDADRADEIRTVIEVFDEFKLPLQIVGGAEAHDVADLLREKGIGVIVPSQLVIQEQHRDVVPAARLHAAGVATAFQSGARGGARFLPEALALAARYGLGADTALEGLTAGAARMLGLEGRIGKLAPGFDGDAVLLSGPPFDLRTRVLHVFVNGREVPQP